jgi:hypothetical protein
MRRRVLDALAVLNDIDRHVELMLRLEQAAKRMANRWRERTPQRRESTCCRRREHTQKVARPAAGNADVLDRLAGI